MLLALVLSSARPDQELAPVNVCSSDMLPFRSAGTDDLQRASNAVVHFGWAPFSTTLATRSIKSKILKGLRTKAV